MRQVADLQDRYRAAEDAIERLKEQLEELTQDKSAHEGELMIHFAQLLNEKKLKIRNQQRLLTSATADVAQGKKCYALLKKFDLIFMQPTLTDIPLVSKIQSSLGQPSTARPHQAGKRRGREVEDTSEDTDEGFDQMNIDQDAENERRSTPQPLEEGGSTPTDNELDSSPIVTPASLEEAVRTKRSALEQSAPPRRELPFIPRGQSSTPRSIVAANEATQESPGETDDDEL